MYKKTLIAALVTSATLFSHAASAVANTDSPYDLAGWTCAGSCGSMLPEGDITTSPIGSSKYGFVSTYGSTAVRVTPVSVGNGNVGGVDVETNGSRYMSSAFSGVVGQNLSMEFNFVSTDGKQYQDWAWARLVNVNDNSTAAWLYTAQSTNSGPKNVVPGNIVSRTDFNPTQVITNFSSRTFVAQTADWSPLGDSNGECYKSANTCGHTGWLNSSITLAAAGNYKIEVGVTNYGDAQFDSGLAFDIKGLTNSVTPVPEPSSYAMMLSGLFLLGGIATRRKK